MKVYERGKPGARLSMVSPKDSARNKDKLILKADSYMKSGSAS
jgi:hypothetical protein